MNKLKQILAQEDTVIFIGSGISSWSGLPSWSGLIEKLAAFLDEAGFTADLVRAEAARGDLLQAASYGFDKLTKHQIGEFIRSACRLGVAEPHEIHKKIVSFGARCYVTTNYDNLLEEALRQWKPDSFFRSPITNRHLTETAEIVHARAIDFVFKPHGDAADSESIILTREQYRELLPQGERHSALDSLKMLLASRPVVYLGFGLRDPDFIYLRDILSNTYKGGIRDHYAIMADVTDSECDYWRRIYGIHLNSYRTKKLPDGTIDHSALLVFLDSLLDSTPAVRPVNLAETGDEQECTPNIILSLARYAAGLEHTSKADPEFPIRVRLERTNHKAGGAYIQLDKFDSYPIEKFLDEGPAQALLIGLPGAGKTYSLRQAASRFAGRLSAICLSDSFKNKDIVVPIYIDLKLYRGNLIELVSQSLPNSLPLEEITRRFQLKIFLDSFNEIPREYWESGAYEADFTTFAATAKRASIIIGSRTDDGLSKLDFPSYCLDQIDEDVVADELQRLGIEIGGGRFEHEVRLILQRPFYFRFITSGAISLPKEAHPRDFYQSFFSNLHKSFLIRFGKEIQLEEILSIMAYDAINRGEEAYPLPDLLRIMRVQIEAAGIIGIESKDIANWLVSSSVLIPYIGGRIAFVHQSITEYLAAKELARRYKETPQILKEKLKLTRWDQALFFTLSLLPDRYAEAFFQDVIKTDIVLALVAVKYIEVDRDNYVSKLLARNPDYIKDLDHFENRVEWTLSYSLPLSETHESQLRELMALGNTIGGAAAMRLSEIKGSEVKDELLLAMLEARDDYNYCCNGISGAIKPFAELEDIKKVADLSDLISDEVTSDSDESAAQGFISGAAIFLGDLEISDIKLGLLPSNDSDPLTEIRARILCNILWDNRSTAALELAGDLLLRGVNEAATSIHFIGGLSKPDESLSWESFSDAHIHRLISMLDHKEEDSWWFRALQCICKNRPDLAKTTNSLASKLSGLANVLLRYCAEPSEINLVLDELEKIAVMDYAQRNKQPLYLLNQIDIKWVGREDLFIKILRGRDSKLALSILKNTSDDRDFQQGQLDFGPIEWWLDWIIDEDDYWFNYFMSRLLALCLSKEEFISLIAEFNKAESKYRAVITNIILYRNNEITTDDFSMDAISFLLTDLGRMEISDSWRGHLLGQTATEQFVYERLFPLLPEAKAPLLTNLKNVIRQAGSRHGRRYEF